MKKFLLTTILCSSFAFASNPKQIDTKALIALNTTLIKQNTKKTDHVCLHLFTATYNLCMKLGLSYETSMSAANTAFNTCVDIFFGKTTTSSDSEVLPATGDSFGG